ncbi:hypothetical protein O7628_17620 [Micromonospora sp. WMMD956]|nr:MULTISPECIES: hypothetical protein [unclassified Micromonospora]MDG4817315.1 hypothetical protein [Micromonospora sp. WMMD956]WFE59877.1 hypothetical protein O7633_24855 [Micromonospora sp. WMMD712]
MIERGSGRTSGLTDWRLMDLLSMWACIQDHDTAGHWKQVAGWRKVCDLARAHLGRLKEYRRGLAEAWPPATNAAARAYLGELDDLIDKVQRTHDAAAANYDALAAATRAISSARTELKPLHDEYVEKLQQKRTYEATAADPKAAMGARVPDKPVTDADLERLNVQARNLMYGLSGELQQAQVMLRQPPTSPKTPRQPDNPDIYVDSVPIIPPVAPVPLTASRPEIIHKSINRATPSFPAPPGIGPVLGGTTSPSTLNNQSLPQGTSNKPTSSPHSVGVPPTLPSALVPLRSDPTKSGPGQFSVPARPTAGGAGSNPPTNPNRPLPPSGLIGGTPGAHTGQSGGSSASRRVNPIGGVIGGGGAGTTPTGAAGSRPGGGRGAQIAGMHSLTTPNSGTQPFGTTPRQEGTRRSPEGDRAWDPDHPWETINGVRPVVRPTDDDGPIDPGPAIGLDR